MGKTKGFWTKPRKEIPRAYLILATLIVVALTMGGLYTVALVAAIALGALVAVYLRYSRPPDSL